MWRGQPCLLTCTPGAIQPCVRRPTATCECRTSLVPCSLSLPLQFCDVDYTICSSCHGCRKPSLGDEGSSKLTLAADGGASSAKPLSRRVPLGGQEPREVAQEGNKRQQCEWPSFGGPSECCGIQQ